MFSRRSSNNVQSDPVDQQKARRLLQELLSSTAYADGRARVDDYAGLRQVDAKVRDGRMVIASLPGFGERLAQEMEQDDDFSANSRRVRLEALANYCESALQFLDAGVMTKTKKTLYRAPDVSQLTQVLPELDRIIKDRWLEAQKCEHAEAYLAAVVMMGSILEALLLARANLSLATAHSAKAAPKRKGGGNVALPEWSLSSLIDVAAEVGWIKVDRKSFGHALRDSRNVVHPWYQIQVRADFDRATCEMCWHVLKSAVGDLRQSV